MSSLISPVLHFQSYNEPKTGERHWSFKELYRVHEGKGEGVTPLDTVGRRLLNIALIGLTRTCNHGSTCRMHGSPGLYCGLMRMLLSVVNIQSDTTVASHDLSPACLSFSKT